VARCERPGRATPKRIRRSLSAFYAGERFPDPDSEEGRLIYDVVLSTRGWGRDEFREATPDFAAAARFAVFAERAIPFLQDQQQIQNTPFEDGMSPDARGDLTMGKLNAAKNIASFRAWLYPEDDDG
jgi:hypothetical protein